LIIRNCTLFFILLQSSNWRFVCNDPPSWNTFFPTPCIDNPFICSSIPFIRTAPIPKL
jgi:hypothetical protein